MKNLFICMAFLLAIQTTLAQTSPADNEKFKAAEKYFHDKKYEDAAHSFEQANKALGGHCYQCLMSAADSYLHLGRRDDVVKSSAKALDAATTPEDKFNAYTMRCRLLLQIEPNSKELAEAEAEARKAVELQPSSTSAHISLGMALLRQSKDDQGIAELKIAEPRIADAAEKKRLQMIIADPRRARLHFAPEFAATTRDGKQITLLDMKGKVVLLDFWATWCPPCRASVPEIKDLRKKYGSDRLIVLSVSADSNQENWNEYITKHDMTWLQSWDKNNKPSVLNAFEIHAFPTYVLLDGDGIVRKRVDGLEEQQTLTARLRDVLDQLMK